MALNTPKRVRTVASFASSPPNSECNAADPGLVSPSQQQWNNGGGGGQTQYHNTTTTTNNNQWIVDGSMSPVSSCGSPDYVISRGPYQHHHHHQHQQTAAAQPQTQPSSQPSDAQLSGIGTPLDSRENRRGRPRSEALTTLMIEGSTSPSAIKCSFCNRVFPREKSLQAHLRTHTGERPYPCDFPGCSRAFTQSGQLKTHQRLHTGERPFMCSAAACQQRFTHANRHCPDHPYDQLRRSDDFVIKDKAMSEQNGEVIKWLEKYRTEKEDRTPTRKTPKRNKTACDQNNENLSSSEHLPPGCPDTSTVITTATTTSSSSSSISNGIGGECLYASMESPSTPSNPYKSRKGLMVELDMNAGLEASPIAPKIKANPKQIQWHEPLSQEEDSGDECCVPATSTFNPKKKWLREAWQDDLARPLDPMPPPVQQPLPITPPQPPSRRFVNPNEMRPTVLMVASRDKTMPLIDHNAGPTYVNVISGCRPADNYDASNTGGNRKWLGALALMQLATNDETTDSSIVSLQPISNAAAASATTITTTTKHMDGNFLKHTTMYPSVAQSYTQL